MGIQTGELCEQGEDLLFIEVDGKNVLYHCAYYEFQVFLHRGQVHIISIADRPSSLTPLPTGQPSIMDAVYVVRSMPHLTLAPPAIQEPIHHRIEK